MSDLTPLGTPQPERRIEWSAQSARATLFAQVTNVRLDTLFEAAFQTPPAAYQTPPNAMAPGTASGSIASGQASVTLAGNRFDVILTPQPVPTGPALLASASGSIIPPHPTLVDVNDAVKLVSGALQRASSLFTSIARLGLGLDLVRPASSLQEARLYLNEILPYGIELRDEAEFLLQRNEPFEIDHPRLSLNSVSRWAIVTVQQMDLNFTIGQAAPVTGAVISSYHLAQKFIDVNTKDQLKSDNQSDISAIMTAIEDRHDQARRITVK